MVKDVVPEFLQLLHGVIDSPDIPLNVSRSYLQSDSNVKKINGYITKKVADKLSELFKKERASFEEKWTDIGIFVKYGMLSEDKFHEKAKDFALLKNTESKLFTFEEYKKQVSTNQTNKDKQVVFLYTNDVDKQDGFIESAKKKGYDVLILGDVLDAHFINHAEQKFEVTFKRVDADVADKLIDSGEEKESVLTDKEKETIKSIFEEAVNNKSNSVSIESMSSDDFPVTITLPEFLRRMKDMQAAGGGGPMMFGDMPVTLSVAVNGNHGIIKKILDTEDKAQQLSYAKQAYDLALLSQGMLTGKSLTDFIRRSVDIAAE